MSGQYSKLKSNNRINKVITKKMEKCEICKKGVSNSLYKLNGRKVHKYCMRLEKIRESIKAENISYSEIAELQSLIKYIEAGDVELLQWAQPQEA